jgi:hypothetical protein
MRSKFGIVEGFFSAPSQLWTKEERLLTFEYLKRYAPNLGVYFYCPKDDPYLVTRWETPYPEPVSAELAETITAAKAAGLRFIFGLNPTVTASELSVGTAQELWCAKVNAKFDQLRALGADGFALLFDDLPIAYDAVDDSLEQSEPIAELMVSLVNRIAERSSSGTEFWFCSPDYCMTKETEITRASRSLRPEVGIIWTGDTIFAPTITEAQLERVQKICGGERKLIWWCNYPTNDCEQSLGELNLGGFPELPRSIINRLEAVLVNPMRESGANFPIYTSLSELAGDPDRYERAPSWNLAVSKLFAAGGGDLVAVLNQFSARNCVDGDPAAFSLVNGTNDDEVLRSALRNWQRRLEIANNATPRDRFGQEFLSAVRPVLEVGLDLIRVLSAAARGDSAVAVTYAERFPTRVEVPRYAPEVLAICIARVARYQRCLSLSGPPLELDQSSVKVASECKTKYRGSARLLIPAIDAERYCAASRQLVRDELAQAISMLFDSRRALRQRIEGFWLRCQINRFTIVASEASEGDPPQQLQQCG